ncbi:hypothetical protein [Microtetraspora malaysiensis]|uniref:hypothetical protein n=1 Tax=Microtetraspora malaysiensis TaxID=161358 RepID=UPI003D92AC96
MKKVLMATVMTGLALATVGAGTAAQASAASSARPWAFIGDGHGGVLAEAELMGGNTIIICDRSTDHRYAMAKVRYDGHTYQYANYYKNQDCIEQKTKNMAHGKIELWACVSKPYKVKFARCGAKTTVVRP